MVSQDAALADDNVFQLNVLAEFQIFVEYVKLDQFTDMFCRVTLPDVHTLHSHCASYTL